MCIDEIEAAVYTQLRPLGFRKYGRTLHRFVSGDLSQIIHFQCGLPSVGPAQQMWVNLGIRIPECDERTFSPSPLKRYYHEYNCTLRSRLGSIDSRQELCFDLREQPSQLLKQILPDVLTKVLPVYDVLSSREAILAHRRDYPHFDVMGRQLILLDEVMICGHLGDLEKAQALFAQYYPILYERCACIPARQSPWQAGLFAKRGAGGLPRAEHHGRQIRIFHHPRRG